MTCRLADRRITCTPLKILVADSQMVASGSVGLDGSLDYRLEVPVTRNLVGREGYRLLAGTTLPIPLTGTIGHPRFDRQAFEKALADVAARAAGRDLEKQLDKWLPGLLKGLGF